MNIIKLLLVMYDVVIGRKCSCIDEIEYGIHTKALDFLLKMYLTIADNCQFVVTTHDLSLLKSKNLRRDAVRMFEKDEYGVTQIKRKYVHNTMNLSMRMKRFWMNNLVLWQRVLIHLVNTGD